MSAESYSGKSSEFVALRDLSFTYPHAPVALFSALNVHFTPGFTGVLGVNGSGKSTLLKLVGTLLQPTSGTIEGNTDVVYCPQSVRSVPPNLSVFLDSWDRHAIRLRDQFQIDPDVSAPIYWSDFSEGERKRMQIATALWCNPRILLLDEPTNHIDIQARKLLMECLNYYRGIGVVVSHDGDMLDTLCRRCVWLEAIQVKVYPGDYSTTLAQRELDQQSARSLREGLLRKHKRRKQEIARKQQHAGNEHARRSKRGLASKDSDAREKINRARLTDSKAGNPLRKAVSQNARLLESLDKIQVTKDFENSIWLPMARSRRKFVVDIKATQLNLGSKRHLTIPNLSISADARISITGPNGAGKSTLVKHLLQKSGVEPDRMLYVPQEVDSESAREVLAQLSEQSTEALGFVMNVVARLGSSPRRILDTKSPSPGEIRKLLLALGMLKRPYWVILDEPTNHLDMHSIEALAEMLESCACALLVVSHELRFLRRIQTQNWSISMDFGGNSRLEPGSF